MSRVLHPEAFLDIRTERVDLFPPVIGACAGYENGKWRCQQLARHVLEWLPEFSLRFSEWSSLTHGDAVSKIAKAASLLYESEEYRRRGEFGEILLHILLRQHAGTIPALSKIYFKDSRNDTVKGFDAVHVVQVGSDLELWLGEVKFYSNINSAINDVIAELIKHTEHDYLRNEFVAITNKIDDQWPQGKQLRSLLSRNNSLDNIFTALCIPILLTYDSSVVMSHKSVTVRYQEDFKREILKHWNTFKGKLPSLPFRIQLYLLPLESKDKLLTVMHEYLEHMRALS